MPRRGIEPRTSDQAWKTRKNFLQCDFPHSIFNLEVRGAASEAAKWPRITARSAISKDAERPRQAARGPQGVSYTFIRLFSQNGIHIYDYIIPTENNILQIKIINEDLFFF